MILRRSIRDSVAIILGILIPTVIALSQNASSKQKDNPMIQQALEAFKSKSYQQSAQLWKSLIDSDSENALYYFNYANAQFMREKYDEALKGYKYVIKLDSPLSPVAKLYTAKTYVKTGQNIEAINLLRDLLHSNVIDSIKEEAQIELEKVDPKEKERREKAYAKKLNAPLEFPLGLKFFKQSRYKLAIINLELASQTYDEPELFLVKGISYYKLGFDEQAEKDFQTVMDKSDDPDLKKNATVLLSLVRKKKEAAQVVKTSNWILNLDGSLNYNRTPLTISKIDTNTKNSEYSFFLEAGRRLIKKETLELKFLYNGSIDEAVKTTMDRFVEHSLFSTLSIYPKQWYIALTPKWTYQESGKKPYTKKNSANITIQKTLGQTVRLGGQLQYSKSEGHGTNLAYLNGNTQYQRIYIGNRGPKFDISLGLIRTQDNFNDNSQNTLSNTGYGESLSLYAFPHPKITLSSTINYLTKNYLPNTESKFIRKDKNTSLALGINYNFTTNFAIYFNSNLTFIDSNINSSITIDHTSASDELFDFQESVSLGFTWDIF